MIETVSKTSSSTKTLKLEVKKHEDPEIGALVAFLTYLSYAVLIIFGHCRDFLGTITGQSRYKEAKPKEGYGVMFKSWESFFTRRLYHRIQVPDPFSHGRSDVPCLHHD